VQQGGQLPIVALAYYDLSRLYLEWNDLPAAMDYVTQGVELSQRGGGVEFMAAGYLVTALIRVAQSETLAAQAALQEAERLLEHPDISPSTRLYSLACHILVALAQDDLQAATWAVERSPKLEAADSLVDYLFLMLAQARLEVAQGRRAAAAERLAALRATALQRGFQYVATQTRALQALAAPNRAEGLALLSEALAEAEPEGYVRTFVAPGESMAVLLRAAAARGIAIPYVQHLLAALGISPPAAKHVAAPMLIEPISDRELQVLCLLAEGQTNQEIAHRLYMSVNTVKTHLKNIYSKLGAKNRAQSAARARELGLIP
jgi:LuxR family maltose regulon positive regulatory protein